MAPEGNRHPPYAGRPGASGLEDTSRPGTNTPGAIAPQRQAVRHPGQPPHPAPSSTACFQPPVEVGLLGSGADSGCRSRWSTRRRAGWNPRSTSITCRKLRINRPAPTSSTQASAISDTTRAPRIQAPRRPSLEPAAVLLQSFMHISAGNLQRRRDAEEQTGGDGHGHGEGERSPIHADGLQEAGCSCRASRPDARVATHRQREAQSRAAARQQRALGEQLADQPPARRAQRHAHRRPLCAATPHAPAAGSTDWRRRSTGPRPPRTAAPPGHAGTARSPDPASAVRRAPQRVPRSGCARCNCGTSRSKSARACATDFPGFSRPMTARVLPQRSVSSVMENGTKEVHLAARHKHRSEVEFLRHHADDGGWLIVQGDGAADHLGVAAEAALPQAVGEDDGLAPVPLGFLGVEYAPQHGLHAQQAEEILCDAVARQALRFVRIPVRL